jgi:hypothetical protein
LLDPGIGWTPLGGVTSRVIVIWRVSASAPAGIVITTALSGRAATPPAGPMMAPSSTVTEAAALFPSTVAVTVACPAATPETVPS